MTTFWDASLRLDLLLSETISEMKEMPIKWNITAKAMKARGIMDQISAEYDGLITDGTEHLGDVKALKAQVGEMKTDLYAAANVMGNGSGNGSGESQTTVEPPKTPPAIQVPETPSALPAPVLAQQGTLAPVTGAAAPPIAHTFRAEAEQQIAAGHHQ